MSTRRFTLVLLASLALALALAVAAQATNRKALGAYEDGLTALSDGKWAEARDAFRQALQIDTDEGSSRIGIKFIDYYPSLGLAEALLELGDPDGAKSALDAFDAVKKAGDEQKSKAQALRRRLKPAAPSEGPAGAAPGAKAPAPAALSAKKALDSGDLAGARRAARQAPTDELSQQVLAAVDALLAERLTAARRDQELGALGAAEQKLGSVLEADPENAAARSLLESVKADARSARDLLADARAALDARRFEDAEDLARQARGRDGSLAEDSRSLEREISAARRTAASSKPPPAAPTGGGAAEGQRLLTAARAALDAGQLAEARTKAADAAARDPKLATEAAAVRTEISRRSAEADEAVRGARTAAADGRFAEARSLAQRAEALDVGLSTDARAASRTADENEAEVGRLRAKIEAHLESGATPAAKGVLQELGRSFPGLPELAALRASVEGSGDVVAGLRAFFNGDLGASIERLTPLAEGAEQRLDVLTVLGSAHASRGLLAGGADGKGGEDLERARELYARALAASPKLELDPRWFSPRIREVFRSAKGS